MKTSGLNVHKDNVFCAIYNGKGYSPVIEYETTTPKIRQMGDYLRREGVEKVTMESTSIYWVNVTRQYDTLPPVIQQLRTYSCKYTKLQEQKTRSLQKMDRIMVMCGFRIGSWNGKSRNMISLQYKLTSV
jgi:hypothetical protein